MNFGERLRYTRLASCISQVKVRIDANIPRSSLGLIEKGKYRPKIEYVRSFAKTLNCNFQWLYDETGAPFPPGIKKLNVCRKPKYEKGTIEFLARLPIDSYIFVPNAECFLVSYDFNTFFIFYTSLKDPKNVVCRLKGRFLGTTNPKPFPNSVEKMRPLFYSYVAPEMQISNIIKKYCPQYSIDRFMLDGDYAKISHNLSHVVLHLAKLVETLRFRRNKRKKPEELAKSINEIPAINENQDGS